MLTSAKTKNVAIRQTSRNIERLRPRVDKPNGIIGLPATSRSTAPIFSTTILTAFSPRGKASRGAFLMPQIAAREGSAKGVRADSAAPTFPRGNGFLRYRCVAESGR